MTIYNQENVEAIVRPAAGDYLQTRYRLQDNAPTVITVGRGDNWTPLACKEVYGKAVKTALSLNCKSCRFDLSAAAELGDAGIYAAAEGIFGGAYQKKFTFSDRVEPEIACYASGTGWTEAQLKNACELAHSIMTARNLVNRPANMLTSDGLARAVASMAEGLPLEAQIYDRGELEKRGLNGMLAVGGSSGNPPALAVLRYTGAPESKERLGFIGKGIAVDTGGYSLKSRASMEGIKGDMAGAAAAATAVRALAAAGVRVNVTAVVPACENRISRSGTVPGDVVRMFSGQTVEILNTDAEGRLILADSLTWAVREEECTQLVDIATLTGAIYQMLGRVAAGAMSNDDAWFAQLENAAAVSGEKFWRMPTYSEYEWLIKSDLADLRNNSKEGCGAITAGLFLQHFTEGVPWIHLDIAGTADAKKPIWQHHVSGATGMGVSSLFHLAKGMEA